MSILAAVVLSMVPVRGEGIVENCTEDDFLFALAGGGEVVFDEDCSITLTDPIWIEDDTTIYTDDSTVTISGDNTNQIFRVASGATLTLSGLTLTGGYHSNGGAIYISPGATVVITNCVLSGNRAVGDSGTNGAAGIDSGTGDGGDGRGGSAGCPAWGGAIYNLGSLILLDSRIYDNSVVGGDGGTGGDGGKGRFNGGDGGKGAAGAEAAGGAVYSTGTVHIRRCTFAGNSVKGGDAGTGGAAGSAAFLGLDGTGSKGGLVAGAALYSRGGSTVVEECTFNNNAATGGNSSAGGTQVNRNGTDGLDGGNGQGGGLCVLGTGGVTNCTFVTNTVTGGAGGNGGSGSANAGNGGDGGYGYGGGIYSTGNVAVVSCTFYFCSAVGGTNGVAGSGILGVAGSVGFARGSGVANGGGALKLMNCLFATNAPGSNVFNISGTITDGGYNLSSDKSSALTSSTSLKYTQPLINTLASNGGPTLTISLQTNSPALDRIPTNAFFPATDQRGTPRPVGKGADIGAYEFASMPTILTQPLDQFQTNGGTVTFKVDAAGEKLKYYWRTNGVRYRGYTAASLTLYNVTITNAIPYYDVIVSNIYGAVTSAPAWLTVAPYIVQDAVATNAIVGDPAEFSVTAYGTKQHIIYQWFFNQTNLIRGANQTNYVISQVTTNDDGLYNVVITNYAGSCTSEPVRLKAVLPPTILVQPVSQVAAVGSNVTFTVKAEGTETLKYQWRFNGVEVAGVTSSSYSFGARTNDAGVWDVQVSGPGGTVRSSEATLTVVAKPPTITSQSPGSIVLAIGQSTNLYVAASGDVLAYQWRLNGTILAGATDSRYAITNAQAGNAGSYVATVSNLLGSVNSVPIVVTVLSSAPSLRIERASQSVLLAWPAWASNYTLQGVPSLSSTQWTNVSATPGLTNGENRVAVPLGPGNELYRLRSP